MDEAAPSKAPESRPDRPRLTPGAAFLLAIWLGLCAGFVDIGTIVAKKFTVNKEGSYRTARDFPWTVPIGHVVLAFAPAAVLAAASWRRPKRASLRAGSWLLATIVLWGALLRSPLHPGAAFILAFGLGKLFGDAVNSSGFGLRVRWVRVSLVGFLCLLAASFAGSTGRRMLGESRAVAGLPSATASAPNVVFIVWDTVRSSSVSLQYSPRDTTPNLYRWAAKGVRFDKALSPSPWTYPSHASFFTGEWPFKINSQWKFALDAPDPTLAEFLTSRGYQTAGFVANTNSCSYETKLDRGFIHFDDYALTPRSLLTRTVPGKWILERFMLLVDPFERKWVGLQSRGAEAINEALLGWLGRRRTDRPFFAFLNFFDAHEPYIPPSDYAGRFGIEPKDVRDYQFLIDYIGTDKGQLDNRDFLMARDCYEDCIAYLDEQLGLLLAKLEQGGLLENTIVVLTSDHGEGFAEHGICGHSYSVEIQEVGVPLVILAPGAPGGRSVPTAVSLRDLPATLTDLLGLQHESPFPGRSLAEHWRVPVGVNPDHPTSPALSEKADETAFPSPHGESPNRSGFEMSLVAPFGFQYVRTGEGREIVFNLWRDPWGQFDLIGSPEGDSMVGRLRGMLLEALTENPASNEVERAYMTDYRQGLADLVQGADVRRTDSRPQLAVSPALKEP